jgi:hypothetical protein
MTAYFRRNVALATLACLCCCFATAAWAGRADTGAPYDPLTERLGPLRLGMPEAEVLRRIACPPRKGREVHEGATGDYVQNWHMQGCGLTLKMAGPRRGSPKSVAAITATAPCRLATGRGVGIGADAAAVTAAYGRFKDEEGLSKPGETFIAGSIYGGLIVTFENGRVAEIFLGAAAE